LPVWKVALATSLVLAISAVVWRYHAQRYLLAGWLWFLITLAPVSGIAQVGAAGMADRFMYTACWGLFAMAIWSLAGWMEQAPSRQTATAFATVAVLLCYAWVSHVQIGYWRDSYSVFSHALKVTGRNGIAEVNLGVALMDMGRTDLAKPHLERAVQILPEFSTAHFNLGTILQSQGKLDQAKQEYMLTLKYTGDPEEAARAHNNLATVMRDSNQPAAAIAEFSAALRLDPDELTSLLGRATLEYRQGDLQGAEKDLRRVSQIAPSAIGFTLLGQVLEERGELGSAVDAYQAALDMSPGQSRLKAHIDAVRQKMQQ
jgi:protein O-mannosyl-transferase